MYIYIYIYKKNNNNDDNDKYNLYSVSCPRLAMLVTDALWAASSSSRTDAIPRDPVLATPPKYILYYSLNPKP